jgi:menaquinol-cytochrome c reductase iron-sulfur subunit
MISPAQTPGPAVPERSPGTEERRGFIVTAVALFLGAVAYLPPLLFGVVSFLNPLRQKGQAGQFMRLATLDALPADGTPLKTTVTMDRVDAWSRSPNQPVGAVFLERIGPKEVRAIHVVCPHAGCFVSYDAGKKGFFCPCHNASFDLEGKRLDAVSNSPRDLDTLECRIEGSEVWVRFQNFRTGTSEKIADA